MIRATISVTAAIVGTRRSMLSAASSSATFTAVMSFGAQDNP